jgi:hypothetical protein
MNDRLLRDPPNSETVTTRNRFTGNPVCITVPSSPFRSRSGGAVSPETRCPRYPSVILDYSRLPPDQHLRAVTETLVSETPANASERHPTQGTSNGTSCRRKEHIPHARTPG